MLCCCCCRRLELILGPLIIYPTPLRKNKMSSFVGTRSQFGIFKFTTSSRSISSSLFTAVIIHRFFSARTILICISLRAHFTHCRLFLFREAPTTCSLSRPFYGLLLLLCLLLSLVGGGQRIESATLASIIEQDL